LDEAPRPPRRREFLCALAIALILAAWPLRKGLWERDSILFGVDTATAQKPWAGLLNTAVQNPELSDQGVVFYPAYVHVSRRWRAGEVPLWNPLIDAGAPLLANPQLGALDPQVLALVGLEALGGRELFDRGFAYIAWLRLAAAGLGAFLLARELGLRRAGAALSAITFAGSGFLIVWLNHSLGHVAPFLPWALLGVERSRSWLGIAGTATALALAILGGHPETAFYVGACAGVWALAILRSDRAHGVRALLGLALGTLIAAVSLVPFGEYLAHSGALVARRLVERKPLDLVALGALMIAIGIAQVFRSSLAADTSSDRSGSSLRAIGVGGLLLAATLLLGWPPSAALLLAPDLMGSPLDHPDLAVPSANVVDPSLALDPWRGEGSYLEAACPWIAAVPLALALAALLSPPASGALRRRGAAAWLGVIALLLAIRTPGLSELHSLLPLVGHGAIARLAVVSALMLGLLAGEALDRAPRPARFASVALIGLLATVWSHGGERIPVPPETLLDPPDGLIGLVQRPPGRVTSGVLPFAGWIDPGLPAEMLNTKLSRWNGREWAPFAHAISTYAGSSPESGSEEWAGVPEGARAWRAEAVDVRYLESGTWRMSLELRGDGGVLLGTRDLAYTTVSRPRIWPTLSLILLAASLVVCALAPVRPGKFSVALLLALPLLQSLRLAEGFHPVVRKDPAPLAGPMANPTAVLPALKFHVTQTEAELLLELDERRFLSDPGILPPNTGMVAGLRGVDGYDALDPASFDAYRAFALKPGVHPLLGFTASGADLDSPAFRLLGVGALLPAGPLEHPGWKRASSPGDASHQPEVSIYVPAEAPPRVFVVGRARKLSDVAATPQALSDAKFEPFDEVLLDDPSVWKPREPLRSWKVDSIDWADERVAVRATLDGDGLLVLTDQHFPGWEVEVDGEPREILAADAIFRGVPLASGTHEVVFTYRPRSVRVGAWISALALAATLACALKGRASTRA
jgi:Bacterial membrane protein YfhO